MHSVIKNTGTILLKIENLSIRFPILRGIFLRKVAEIRAVEHVNLTIYQGEVLALIGESGSGKTTLGKAIINILYLNAAGVDITGSIIFYENGVASSNLLTMSKKEFQYYRKRIQMIFQDPFASLNPRMLIRDIIQEPLRIDGVLTETEQQERVDYLLERVGLSVEQSYRYPHEFSGGQRQRIGIARSLVTNPTLIIADEPVSALDVSIQAQIINLIKDLQKEFHFTFVFIAHDLAVVHHISNRIAVMYLGHIVEVAHKQALFERLWHPYTRSLIASTPMLDASLRKKKTIIKGEISSAISTEIQGCIFAPRCPLARDVCYKTAPIPQVVNDDGHQVSCHFYTEVFPEE